MNKHARFIQLPEYMKNNEIHVTETQTDTARDIELLERVKMQLEVARSHFRNINENVARLYSPVSVRNIINVVNLFTHTDIR